MDRGMSWSAVPWMNKMGSRDRETAWSGSTSSRKTLVYRHMDTLAPFDLWLADYRGKRPARRHGMWQYTSRGRVPGISGPVDLSRTEKDYPALLHRAGLDRTIL